MPGPRASVSRTGALEAWHAAYDKATEIGMSPPLAVRCADRVLASAQARRFGGITAREATEALSRALGAPMVETPTEITIREAEQQLQDALRETTKIADTVESRGVVLDEAVWGEATL